MDHNGHADALDLEYRYCLETGRTEQAKAVLAELKRVGRAPASENTAESAPVQRAVAPKKTAARGRK